MSCYSPVLAEWQGEFTENGKKKYKIVSKACDQRYESPNMIRIPCGKCIGCRLDYSRQWADRMMLELDVMKKAVFVTLTYDNDHLDEIRSMCDDFGEVIDNPLYLTLNKRHCQLFMKALRNAFPSVRVRFFLSGEYGETTFRPHYHAILFGLSLDDFAPLVPRGRNELGQPYFSSEKMSHIWKNGYHCLADVSWETCAYVARYCMKKLNGDLSDFYTARNVIPEFSLMSRKPGIGSEYLSLHPDCLDYSEIDLMTENKGLKITIPKYFLRLGEKDDPLRFEKLRRDRKQFAEDKALSKLLRTDLRMDELLDVERRKKEDATNIIRHRKGDF